MNCTVLEGAIQKACQEPPRTYSIDSRQSTPEVYPSCRFDEFEYWREPLVMISQSLEGPDKDVPSMGLRMRIMDVEYWKLESSHWKALLAQIFANNNINQSVWEGHYLDIDAKYWETVSSFDWLQSYHDLGYPHSLSNLEGLRSTVSDIIFYKVSAEQWKSLCAEYDGSYDLERSRNTIRSSHYWQTEFDTMSEACRKRQRSAAEKGRTRPTPREQRTQRTRVHKQRNLRVRRQANASPPLPNRQKSRLPITFTDAKTPLRRSHRISENKGLGRPIAKTSR